MWSFLRHLRAAFRRTDLDRDLRREMEQHLEWKAQEYADAGVPANEARRRAAVDVGNITRVREDARDVWGFPTLDSILQDVQYGIRLLLRAPAFSIVAILSLAIGIGATTAVFGLADAVLLRKLAVPDPGRLVVFKWFSGPVFPFSSLNGYGDQTDQGLASTSFSRAAFDAFRREGARYLDVTGFADLYQVNLAVDGQGDTGRANVVDGRYFSVLGVQAALGRTLLPADDREGAPPAAAISHAFWLRRFGGQPAAIGRTVSVNAVPFTIAGVLPAAFHGTGQAGTDPDVYLPIAMRPLVVPNDDPPGDPNFWWVLVMGRLKPGVRAEDARGALDLLLKQTVAAAKPRLTNADLPRLALLPGARGQLEERAEMAGVIGIMAAVTAVVLLVACANVASLLLARGRARVREMSVRAAIGAPRRRLVRQLFTEAALLSAAGTALGVVLARGLARALLPALSGAGSDPLMTGPSLDWRLLTFAAGIASVSAVIFGLLPAVRATDVHLAAGLEESRRGLTATRQRRLLSGSLVALQIALSLLLLTGAGLLVRSVRNLERVSVGFDAHNLLLFQIDPLTNGYGAARAQQLYATVLDRLRAVPGVTSASLSSHRLISNSSTYGVTMRPEETPPERGSADARAFGKAHGTYILIVDEDFFRTMGIPIVRGRAPRRSDASGERVAVVNRSLALRLYGTEDAVGRQLRSGMQRNQPPYRIVGVCADARYTSLRRPVEGTAYLYFRQQAEQKSASTFEVRTVGPPGALAETARGIVRELDPTLPVSRVGTQAEQIAASVRTERLFARLATLLGLIALSLSAIGLYGLLAYTVVQRTPEIGIRMALGAAVAAVRWMVLRESLALVAIGLAAGIPAALAGTRVLNSLLFGLPARDPVTLAAAAAFMLALALVAAYLPARRATLVDPLIALRIE